MSQEYLRVYIGLTRANTCIYLKAFGELCQTKGRIALKGLIDIRPGRRKNVRRKNCNNFLLRYSSFFYLGRLGFEILICAI